YLYGLMADGRQGVDRTIEILSAAIVRTMKLLGGRSLDELEPTHVTQLHRLLPRYRGGAPGRQDDGTPRAGIAPSAAPAQLGNVVSGPRCLRPLRESGPGRMVPKSVTVIVGNNSGKRLTAVRPPPRLTVITFQYGQGDPGTAAGARSGHAGPNV